MTSSRVMYSPTLTEYNFGKHHPMGPNRVRRAFELADSLGVLRDAEVTAPDPIDDDVLRLVHSRAYIEAVQSQQAQPVYGIGTEDNPLFDDMHRITREITAASVQGLRSIASGEVSRVANISGGLHHAMPSGASGFCIYNDVAVAIRALRVDWPDLRVAYVDVDAHHGDGVQEVFWDDPQVLTVSLHESPVHLFPGTGFAHEVGGRAAIGSAVNVALPPATDDGDWLRAFHAIVPQVVQAFQPDILITQHGADAHRKDPLTDLNLSLEGMATTYRALADLADRCTGGRWLAVGGGGYAMPLVVPRAWAHLIGVVAGRPIDPTTRVPETWLAPLGLEDSLTMGDGGEVAWTDFDDGFNPTSRLDQAIRATRKAVFPELGLNLME